MDNATTRWLTKLAEHDKAHGGTGTDYRLAQLLGIEPATLRTSYRRRGGQMDDEIAVRCALALGVNPMKVVGEIRAERSKDARTKSFWSQAAQAARAAGKKKAAVVGGLVAVMMTAMGYTPPADARGNSGACELPTSQFIQCAQQSRRRRRRPRWLEWLLSFPALDVLAAPPGQQPALA